MMRCLFGLFVVLFLTTGCGYRITDVSGTVTVDGMPLSHARVIFVPHAEQRPAAMADTNADGVYRLYRQGPGKREGAATGVYTVKVVSDPDNPLPIEIPPEYNTRSELTFEVKAGQPNVFDIDITSK